MEKQYTTRVALSMSELITLASAMEIRIMEIDQLIDIAGDPNGTQAKNRARAEALRKKFDAALKRL